MRQLFYGHGTTRAVAVGIHKTASHARYRRLNELLDENGFDAFVEGLCEKFHTPTMGRPSLAPGTYFSYPADR